MSDTIGNWFMETILNSPLHPLLGKSFAVITVRGRKTGALYSTPINVTREGDTFIILSQRQRTWWRNLRGGCPAQLRVSGKRFAVCGEVIESQAQVVEGLTGYLTRHPGYAPYLHVHIDTGQPRAADVERAAGGRVIVRLLPAEAAK